MTEDDYQAVLHILSPFMWPFANLATAVSSKKRESREMTCARPTFSLEEHLTAVAESIRAFLLAVVIVYGFGSNEKNGYPAYGRGAVWKMEWMVPIVIRNLMGAFVCTVLWDYVLYFSPMRDLFKHKKMNQVYPAMSQFAHDTFWTTVSTLLASVIEIALCHVWATGAVGFEAELGTSPMWNVLWIVTLSHWRQPYNYVLHRAIHPWNTERIFDLGQWLWTNVHELHHESYNPTAVSGTSMHPVESTLFYLCALIPVWFGCHPVIVLACMIDSALGVWLGHDGFSWPGAGDFYHYLHHANVHCNFGHQQIPMDYWLGTFAATLDVANKKFEKKNGINTDDHKQNE